MKINNQITISENFDYKNLLSKVGRIYDLLDVSETTRDEYKQRIKLFLLFIKKNRFNQNSFLEFKRYLKNRVDYSVSTKNKYLASTRIFLKELNRQGLLLVDITQNIKVFSQIKKHKRDGLNEEEIINITSYLHNLEDNKNNTRLKAIFCFLTFQGFRQCEITRLKITNIDLVNKTAQVMGKGRDDYELVNLHPETVRCINIYLKGNKLSDGYLFPSKSNKNLHNQLTVRGLRLIIKEVLSMLNISKSVHGFRHYFTTKLIKNYHGDLLEVAKYTRHRSLEMLQVYNDNIKQKKDLPRYYKTFNEIKF